jgi:hypothetical protein
LSELERLSDLDLHVFARATEHWLELETPDPATAGGGEG